MQFLLNLGKSGLKPLFLITPFFLWGTTMVAMKGAMPHTTPFFMMGLLLFPSGVLVLIFAAFLGKSSPQGWLAWSWIILFSLVDGFLLQAFLVEGLAKTGAGLSSVIINSQPLAIMPLSARLFQEWIGLWGWLGLGWGIVGISLISLPTEWLFHWLNSSPLPTNMGVINWEQLFTGGEWLMLISALLFAIATLMIRFVMRHVDIIIATGWHMIFGGLSLWGISWMFESEQWEHLEIFDWLGLGYSAVFGTAIANGLFFYFAGSENLSSLSSLTFLTPIFSLVFGYLFLGEVLTPMQWTGVFLTFMSIYLINQREFLADKTYISVMTKRKIRQQLPLIGEQQNAGNSKVGKQG